ALIHELTGSALKHEIPGLKEINAVDAAGVHPLLLAIGSERYTPYLKEKKPSELLTISNRILGTGQLSLAKFLFITCDDSNKLSVKNIPEFLKYCLERIDFTRDLHFQTNTSIDTLDYSGTGLNSGSKVVLAAYGEPLRKLCTGVPESLSEAELIMPGVLALPMEKFSTYEKAREEFKTLNEKLKNENLGEVAMLIACDNAAFVAEKLNNFLWVTFTRSNPSHDIYGINSFTENKHWSCKGSLIIDARIKPHHAPALGKDLKMEEKINRIFEKGGSLHGIC
ncbi:MAG TPA: 3-octaprenyl-4-hydroxybenzoate carboxy-lyase, partial [Bacteroidia bacterium]|nr:3-octaprenyl-4-hydroxybenzoate carboxy-lyase [Bacteroidia bacterium]